jgi:hypothetical protein
MWQSRDHKNEFKETIIMNGWTIEKMVKLSEWMNACKLQSRGNSLAYSKYSRLHNWSTIIGILIGVGITITEGTNLLLDQPKVGLGALVIVLSSLGTAVAIYLKSFNPSKVASDYERMAKSYTSIMLTVESELTNDFNERIEGNRFLQDIRNKLVFLSDGGRTIPDDIWKRVMNELKEGKMNYISPWDKAEHFLTNKQNDTQEGSGSGTNSGSGTDVGSGKDVDAGTGSGEDVDKGKVIGNDLEHSVSVPVIGSATDRELPSSEFRMEVQPINANYVKYNAYRHGF